VSQLPDLLFVTHRVPFPPDRGDRVRTYHLLRFLARRARVHLASLVDEPVSDDTVKFLSGTCARVHGVPLGRLHSMRGLRSFLLGGTISEGVFRSKKLAHQIREWSGQTRFSAAVASSASVARYLRAPELRQATKIVDMVDVDSEKWFDFAAASGQPKKWVYQTEARRLRRREKAICSWADVVTLVSDHEAAVMREVTGTDNIHTVTSGVDLRYYAPTRQRPEAGCLFVGALNTLPSVDAITWFAHTVWPHLRHRRPEARLRVVGRRPVAAVRELAEIPGIEVVGTVSDIRPYLDEAAVVVAPLRIARGLQTKVLEAMAAGKAVVATPATLASFGEHGDLPAVPASEPEEWVESVCRLLEDESERRHLGQAGRRYAEQHHNWDACLEPLGHLLRKRDQLPVAVPI
jgi:sugar transferase (PEP-CTERM/EpsH1 system associated)